jgi:hypothetical protein
MAQKNLYVWVGRFKHGRTSLDIEDRSGRPSASETDDHRADVNALIKDDRWITITVSDDEVASITNQLF